jgi:oligosaccharide repeat unit polymerase
MTINGVIGLIIVIHFIYTWWRIDGTIISTFLLFYVLLVIFNFGQSILFLVIKDNSSDRNLFRFANYDQIIPAQYFTILCLIAFGIGAIYGYGKLKIKKSNVDINIINKSLKYVGLILLAISLPAIIYEMISMLTLIFEYGYIGLYNYNEDIVIVESLLSKIIRLISNYFVPSLIILFIAYKNSKFHRFLILFAMTLVVLYNFYVGLRTSGITIVIVIALMYHRYIKKFTFKNLVISIAIGLILILVLNTVGDVRSINNKTIDIYLYYIVKNLKMNPVAKIITELGWNMFPLIAIMKIIPNSFSYAYGSTYIIALTSIVPNLGFWDVHPSFTYADGPNWLMNVLHMSYGPGFSISAEAYRNFGWLGFPVLAIFGILFVSIYSQDNDFISSNRPDIYAIMLIIFILTVSMVRGDFLGFIRPVYYIVIPIYILLLIATRYLVWKENN